jgi:small conductance mechanosensitive channel
MYETIIKSIKEFKFLQDALATLIVRIITFIPNLLVGIFVLFLFYIIYRIIRYIVTKSLKKAEIQHSVIDLINKMIKWSCLGLALILVADQIGIKIITLISTLGVAGIAIGLAAQQTLANFISGIIILWSKPFRENDLVELEDIYGKVEKISLRSTSVLTEDNILVDFPNQKIIESKIINHTFNKNIRIRILVGIAYKESIPDAQKIILDIVKDDDRFLKKPAPQVVVKELADSSVNLELQVWIHDSRFERPLSYELRQKIKLAFDSGNIQIPFPHRQIFVEDVNVDNLKKLVTNITKMIPSKHEGNKEADKKDS